MKRIITILLSLILSTIIYSQTTVTVSMSGAQVRSAINGNFTHNYSRENVIADSVLDAFNRIAALNLQMDTVKNGNMVNPKNYGAVGNGIHDDRAAFVSALTVAINTQGTLYIPEGNFNIGTYAISSAITNKHLKIIGSGNSVISGGAYSALAFTSSYSGTSTFSVSPVEGDDTLSTSLSGVSQGDILQIRSTDQYSNIDLSDEYKGELVEVESTYSGHIVLVSPIYDNYDKNTSTIRNLNAGSVSIEGVKFDSISVAVNDCKNVVIKDCEWVHCSQYPISLTETYNALVEHNNINLFRNLTYSGYAISIGACQNVMVTKNTCTHYTQAIAVGGQYPTRNYLCSYNNITALPGYWSQLDTHPDVQYATFLGNKVINGGIYACGTSVDILYNICLMSAGEFGITRVRQDIKDTLNHQLQKNRTENITGNQIYRFSPNDAGANTGIAIKMTDHRDTIDWINVSDNYVQSDYYAFVILDGTAGLVKNINIHNNYFESLVPSINACVFISPSITIDNIVLSDNIVNPAGAFPLYAATGLINKLSARGNTFNNGTVIVGGNMNATFQNNTFNKSSIVSSGGTTLHINNNTFNNSDTIYASGYYYIFFDVDTAIVQNNTYNNPRYNEYIGHQEGWLKNIYTNEFKSLKGALTDGAPTNTEVNTICGSTAELMRKGFRLIIEDTTGTKLTYTFISDGTSWILQGVPAKAV